MLSPLIRSPLLDIAGLEHGFTYLATPPDLAREWNEKTATCKQVHKNALHWVAALEKGRVEADAIATAEPSLPVGVYSADCAPILVVALTPSSGKPAGVMAVHAGWRGTALQIAFGSFTAFQDAFPRHSFRAVIGPCISFARFEVGEEVVAAFPGSEERGLASFLREEQGKKKYLFDLAGENARQLELAARSTAADLQIHSMKQCTLSEPDRLPSFRRDGANAGRILSFIGRIG